MNLECALKPFTNIALVELGTVVRIHMELNKAFSCYSIAEVCADDVGLCPGAILSGIYEAQFVYTHQYPDRKTFQLITDARVRLGRGKHLHAQLPDSWILVQHHHRPEYPGHDAS